MLTLTSIVRSDVRPSEAAEIARRIERGGLSFHDLAHVSSQNERISMTRHRANAREADVIVRALRAFG